MELTEQNIHLAWNACVQRYTDMLKQWVPLSFVDPFDEKCRELFSPPDQNYLIWNFPSQKILNACNTFTKENFERGSRMILMPAPTNSGARWIIIYAGLHRESRFSSLKNLISRMEEDTALEISWIYQTAFSIRLISLLRNGVYVSQIPEDTL